MSAQCQRAGIDVQRRHDFFFSSFFLLEWGYFHKLISANKKKNKKKKQTNKQINKQNQKKQKKNKCNVELPFQAWLNLYVIIWNLEFGMDLKFPMFNFVSPTGNDVDLSRYSL